MQRSKEFFHYIRALAVCWNWKTNSKRGYSGNENNHFNKKW